LSSMKVDLPRKAWSMEDDRRTKALALLDYVESKQKLAILHGKITEVGEFLIAVGEDLKTHPSMYVYKKYTMTPQSEIDVLVNQLTDLKEATEQLRRKAADFGVSL
jgi:hypothetical protein